MSIISKIINWISFPYSLYMLLKNPGISRKAKFKAGMVLAALLLYLLSPADLIPDLIPALGWLDDLAALPLAMFLVEKLVPEVNLPELTGKARADARKILAWTILLVAAMALISLSALGLIIFLAIKFWR